MSAPRLATIPFEHVEAELAAFPLASEASFRLGPTSLNPQVSRAENDRLWRATERDLLNALPSIPHDEAVTIRDKLWFDSASLDLDSSRLDQSISRPVSLHNYLRRLAESYLEADGRPNVSASERNTPGRAGPERARLRWSWMCQALPPDLLRVARGVVAADDDPFPRDPNMQQMHDRGFAETHLHLGAALDFSLAWAALMLGLTSTEVRHSDFRSPGACFGDGRSLGAWLLHAAVVRLILAEWLFEGASSGSSIDDLLKSSYERPGRRLDLLERNRLANLLSELTQGGWFRASQPSLRTWPQDDLDKRFARTGALYRRLIAPPHLIQDRQTERSTLRALYKPKSRNDVFANDPLARVIGWHRSEGTTPETCFVKEALSRMAQNSDEDSDFARLFWQLIRIRCLLYRHVVQRPLTPGLQWFVRFFSRIKPLRQNISETVLINTAARLSGKGFGLRSLELRLGTEASESACLEKVRDVENAALPHGINAGSPLFRRGLESEEKKPEETAQAQGFEVGALFHFSRKRGGGWESGKPNAYGFDHSYPGMLRTRSKPLADAGNPTGFRFARFYLEQRRHAQALVNVFQKYPRVLRTARGVDLCTDEAGVPVWVMAPLVQWVREAGQEAAKQLERRDELQISFRTSVHAGEDFVHLLTGLRRLDEAVTYLGLEENDRLGHALALGIDPSVWCGRVGQVIQTREERLFDLVWEWKWYSAKPRPRGALARRRYVRSEIERLTEFIFGSVDGASYTPNDLIEFMDLLHDKKALHDQGFPDRPARRARHSRPFAEHVRENGDDRKSPALVLLSAYLSDERVWRQGRIPETIDMHNGRRHEQAALSQLQKLLHRKIRKLGLTIEVNPSSNLLVGDLGNLVGHPLWRLRSVAPVYLRSWPGLPQYLLRALQWQFRRRYRLSVCIGSDDPLTFATTLPHEYQLLYDAMILRGHSRRVARNWIDAVRDAGMRRRFTLDRNDARSSQPLRPSIFASMRPKGPP